MEDLFSTITNLCNKGYSIQFKPTIYDGMEVLIVSPFHDGKIHKSMFPIPPFFVGAMVSNDLIRMIEDTISEMNKKMNP